MTTVDGVSSATLPMEGAESDKYFTLDGDGHTISAAENSNFCFLINTGDSAGTTTVKDLTIDGGSNGSKVGGAFFLENGNIVFDNVTFIGCGATTNAETNGGGALCLNNHGGMPSVTVRNCTFENCYVGVEGAEGQTGRGGAIYANHFNTSAVTDETAVMELTVENSTFTGNKAAYGGAIAADGNVDLTVTGCTFENNQSTVGGDDIYIFEGVSTGKKSMSIYSDVNAVLSGNDYTNDTNSDSDMTAMNVIYGRYYPAGYTGTPGTAPEGAADLTFSDIARTQIAEEVASIAMQSLEIAGKTYYYGVAPYGAGGWVTDFTVNSTPVEAVQIGDTNVYYYAGEALQGALYGTATLTYAEFYAGDITDTSTGYDAVSSATTGKNTMFTNEDSTEPVEGEGYSINGLNNVPVQVSAEQYVVAEILEAANALSGQSAGYTEAAAVTLNADAAETPAWYKTLDADGSYGAMVVADAVEVSDATAELNTSSNWGDYLVAVTETSTSNLRNDRNEGWPVGENIMGIIVEATKDDQTIKVGLRHLENIWVQTYEFAFDNAGATADLVGATINKITYIVPENVYEYTFEDGIYVLPQYSGETNLSSSFSADYDSITISGIPTELEDVTVNVYLSAGHGQRTMIVTNATPDENGTVLVDSGAEVAMDTVYTVQISSSNYADLQTTVSSGKSLADWAAYEAGFETFLNYMDDEELDSAWERAAAAMSTSTGTDYTADSLKQMWTALCATTTAGQDTPIANMVVDGQTVTFTDASGDEIASYNYVWADTVEQGLEGAETFVFKTDDADAGVFTYLAMMAPGYDEGMAAHFHFRYGATEESLDLENQSNMWYPTMLDASATIEEKAQVILAMHGADDSDGTQSLSGEADVAIYGYTAKVLVTYDPETGEILSVSDNGTEPGINSSFWSRLSGNTTYAGKNFWEQFSGLTKEGVEALQITPSGSSANMGADNVDAVSSATYSSAAVKQAVLNALTSD